MAYIPPYTLTDKIVFYVSDISERLENISLKAGLSAKPRLRKNSRIKSVHSSLAIEANSLSLEQVRDVIDGRLVIGEQREIQEVKNAYAAYEEIGSFDVYSVDELKRMHAVMTRYTVEESGVFRRGEEGVFKGGKCIFMAPPARFVNEQVKRLFDWMKKNKDSVHPLILSAVFHYEFVFIHPFADGNGRMARLWHTAILSQWKPIFELIPIESQIIKFQDGYYDAIAKCHQDGESTAFIEFMLEQISIVLSQVNCTDTSSEYVKRLLSVMEYGTPYTAVGIMELLGLKSRDALRKSYLNPAIEAGLIKMTVPDKPNSKNQRYVKI